MARDRRDDASSNRPDDQGTRISPKVVISLIALAVLLVFAFQNTNRVRVDFLGMTRDARLIYVIIGSAVLGAIVDRFVSWRRRRGD